MIEHLYAQSIETTRSYANNLLFPPYWIFMDQKSN